MPVDNDESELGPNQHFRVLIIEDDAAMCEIMEAICSLVGYQFKIVNDVETIAPLINEFNPHLILIDYLLPSSNGGDLCQQVKGNQQTTDIPVIIYSAYNRRLLPVHEYQCDAFIEKPFDIDHLLFKIEMLLTQKNHFT